MEELNGQKFPDGDQGEKELYVRRLQTKKERQKARAIWSDVMGAY